MLPVLLSLSVLGLFAGAALVAVGAMGRLRAGASGLLEGLALGMFPALVLARLIPHAYESLGPGALWLAAIGFGLVAVSHHAGERTELRLGSALALPALLLHAATDGAALAMSSSGRVGDSASLLAFATILHRIPEGFFVASRRRGSSPRAAFYAAAPLALATIAGAVLGQRVFAALPDTALDAVLALGAGAMLRLVVHSHDDANAPQPRAARALAAAALLCGIAIVVFVPGTQDVLRRAQPKELSMARSLGAWFIESAPCMLLGVGLTAALRMRRGGGPLRLAAGAHAQTVLPGLAALKGLTLGAVRQLSPTCWASEAPRLRDAAGSVSGSASATSAWVAGLGMAATQLGLDSAALSLAWVGPQLSGVRVLGGALIGLCLSTFLGVIGARHDRRADTPAGPLRRDAEVGPAMAPTSAPAGFTGQVRTALETTGAGLLLGLLLAAAAEAGLPAPALQHLSPAWAGLLGVLLALVSQGSALTATPVVAVLMHKGLSAGTALTYLWLCPLASVPSAVWLGRQASRAKIVGAASVAVVISLGAGRIAQRLLPACQLPDLHGLVTRDHALWEYACAAALAALLLGSLMRLGPRGFAAQIVAPRATRPNSAHDHHHDHHEKLSQLVDTQLPASARRW